MIDLSHVKNAIKSYHNACGHDRAPRVMIAIHEPSHVSYIPEMSGTLKSSGAGDIKFLSLDYTVKAAISSGKLPVTCLDIGDIVNSGDYGESDALAMKIAAEWFISDDGGDLTIYDGISFASMIQMTMSYLFSNALKCATEIKIIKERLAADIFLFVEAKDVKSGSILLAKGEDLHYRFARLLGSEDGTIVEKIEIPLGEEGLQSGRGDLKEFIKKMITRSPLQRAVPRAIRDGGKNVLFSSFAYIGQDLTSKLLSEPKTNIVLFTEDVSANDFFHYFFNKRIFSDSLNRYFGAVKDNTLVRARENFSKARSMVTRTACYRQNTIVFDAITHKLDYIFNEKFPSIAGNISAMGDFLAKYCIKCVVVAVDVCPYEKSLVAVAKKMGIPSLVVQHGISGHPIAYLPLSADKIAVWGDVTKKWFIKNGVSSERIEVVGAPRFDTFTDKVIKRTDADRLSYLKGLGLDPEKKTIVVVVHAPNKHFFANYHWSFNELMEVLSGCVEAVKGASNEQLIVKFKPGDSCKPYAQTILKAIGASNVICVDHTDLCSLLHACDCVITGWSTMGIEAMVVGKPAICVDRSNKGGEPIKDYVGSGAVLYVKDLSKMRGALDTIFYNEEKRKDMVRKGHEYADGYIYNKNNKASERVKDVILNMMNGGRS